MREFITLLIKAATVCALAIILAELALRIAELEDKHRELAGEFGGHFHVGEDSIIPGNAPIAEIMRNEKSQGGC